jgi:hypothetical protein
MDDLTECATIDDFILRWENDSQKLFFNRFGALLGVFLQARWNQENDKQS